MFAPKDRPPHGTAASSRPSTLAASLPTTSSEFSPAASAPEQRKMNVLWFDNDTKPFYRNPFGLTSIQNPRGCTPSVSFAARKEIRSNPSKMNTYAKCAANSCRMRTYKIIELKVSCNEHLRKMGLGGVLLSPNPKWEILDQTQSVIRIGI
jgi:hypothetical protein